MALPQPTPALVIRYAYLWHEEFLRGLEEGSKDRPCAVILALQDDNNEQVVTVLPITHTPPKNSADAVEIPSVTKKRLGLDDERSWVVLTESNRFIWPGPDLRPVQVGRNRSIAYGLLPAALFNQIQLKWLALYKERKSKTAICAG